MVPEDYKPWYVLDDIQVGIMSEWGPANIELPFVAARSRQAVETTAIIVAHKMVRDMMAALRPSTMDQKQIQIENLRKLKYDPPRQRFWCEECDHKWDAWVDEDGELEDKWSVVCTNGECPNHGGPATLLHE